MRSTPEFSLADFDRVLNDPILDGVRILAINGGEPTLREDLTEIVASCLPNMPRLQSVTLDTNGFLTERVLKETLSINRLLRDRGIRLNLSLSIDGIGETHDRIRGVKGAFERVTETLRELKKHEKREGFFIAISCVLFERNAEEFDDLLELGKRFEVPVYFAPLGIHESFVSNWKDEEEIRGGGEGSIPLLNAMKRLSEGRGMMDFSSMFWNDLLAMRVEKRKRSLPCPLAIESLVLDAIGDVYLCLSESPAGNVRSGMTLSDIWNSKKIGLFRDYLKKERCPTCNSTCMAEISVRNHIQRYLWYLLKKRFRRNTRDSMYSHL